jgi:hypothetical protein
MNALKHMEAIFIAAALVAVPLGYMGSIPDANARNHDADSSMVASGAKMAVVSVSAKRLSPAEKSVLLAADTVTVTAGSRM